MSVPDQLRPLTEQGRLDIGINSAFLEGVEWIAASPLRRSQESAEIVCERCPCEIKTWKELTPSATPNAVYCKLVEVPGTGLLVTHQPFVDQLVADLTAIVPRMSPGALALVSGEAMMPGYCELRWVRQP